jgi:tetratricopeptide (TPR) repeat protein
LAEAYRRTNDPDRAYEAFQRAISLGINFIEAYESCAAAARQAAGAAASAGNIDQVHRWNQRVAEQLAAVGRLYAAGRVAAKAEPAFREALELDPENATIFSAYGDLLVQMGRLSEAEPIYRKALLLDPQSAHAYNNLGSLLKELGRADEAEDAWRRAYAIDPSLMEPAYALSSGELAALNYRANLSAEEIFEAHRRWGDELMARQTESVDDVPNEPNPDRPAPRRLCLA